MANKVITTDIPKGDLKHYGVKGMRWGVRRYQSILRKAQNSPKKVKYMEKANQIKKELLSDRKIKKMLAADRINNPKTIASLYATNFGLGTVLGYTGISMVIGPAGMFATSVGLVATHSRMVYSSISNNDIATGKKWIEQNLGNEEIKQYNPKDIQHSDDLAHYGVLGMKWGIRKDDDKGNKLSGGISKLGLSAMSLNLGDIVGRYARGTKEKKDDHKNIIDSIDELNRFDPSTETVFKAVKNVNEAFKFSDYNGYRISGDMRIDFTNNCPSATMAYELRRRGYDSEAGLTGGIGTQEVLDLWGIKDKELLKAPPKDIFDIIKGIEEMGPGARGFCMMQWENGGGHICSFEVDELGSVIFIDAQTGKTSRDKFLKTHDNPRNYIEYAKEYTVARIDNRKIKDKKVAKWVRKDD